MEDVVLRDVVAADVPIFFEHQRDPEAVQMAAFPSRDRQAFEAHWQRILGDDAVTIRTVVVEGAVAGNVVCFPRKGLREVGYWIGREFWGQGIATRALAELLREVTARPLHAVVACTNLGSIRVLEKCGFVVSGYRTELDVTLGEEIEEALLQLG